MFYFLFFSLLLAALVASLRLTLFSSPNKFALVNSASTLVLSAYLTLALLAVTTLYYLLDNLTSLELIATPVPGESLLLTRATPAFLLDQAALGLHLTSAYVFPFVYIFILVTTVSVMFCMSYNLNELNAFLSYCTIILSAGYSMFFTSSLLIFFLSYEMLLVPSFFILYNFAKTRKCVEAAYLMFF